MSSNFPASFDSVAANKTNSTVSLDDHSSHHNDLADAVNAIQTSLGVNLANVIGLPQQSQSANYTLTLADAGRSVVHPITDNNARTFTIPSNFSVAYPVGTQITFVNMANTLTVELANDLMYQAAGGSYPPASVQVAAYGVATALKVTNTSWIIWGENLTADASLSYNFLAASSLPSSITFTRASTATFFNSAGVLQSAAIDVPRLDYNPSTLAAQGLLIEESRTNGLRYSEAFMTQALTVTGVSGTFANGETVTATGGGTGTYISADSTATVYAIYNGTGAFSGTLTGGTSGATATISSSQTNGTITRASIVPDATTAPNGSIVAEKLVEDTTATNTHSYQQNSASVTSGTTYALSIFAKAAERTWALFLTSGTPFGSNGVYVNLTNGALGTTIGSPLTTSVQNCGNGWYRITVTFTAISTGSAGWAIRLATADNVSNYTGDGTSGLFIWGAQLEAGDFPTSYIPTTTTALTRSADVASVNTLSPWFNATEGTLFADWTSFIPNGTSPGSTYAAGFTDNIASTLAAALVIQNRAVVNSIRVWQSTTGGGLDDFVAISLTTYFGKAAAAYGGGTNVSASANGGAVVTMTNPIQTTAFNALLLGLLNTASTGSGSNYLNGHIKRVTYYPRRLSNAELVSITT